MAFDFPNTPTANQIITMPDGTQRMWDGTKWRAAGLAPGPYMPLAGGTMQGSLITAHDPTSALEAANKEYVDAGVAASENNTGRNFVQNAVMAIAQRGTAVFSAAGYTLDRWFLSLNTDTSTVQQLAATDAMRTAISDQSPAYIASVVVNGNAAAAAFTRLYQPVEDVRRLGGKTVTASFYASGPSTSAKIGVSFNQYFGTGGSPSATVVGNGQAATLTGGSAWTRYTLTFTLPGIVGMTLGTNNDHNTTFAIWFSSGATNNTQSGGVGVQSGTFQLWGVQLELGTQATPLDKGGTPQQQLSACQRFYVAEPKSIIALAYLSNAWSVMTNVMFPVTMRAIPSITLGATSNQSSNWTSSTIYKQQTTGFTYSGSFNASGNSQSEIAGYTASADL